MSSPSRMPQAPDDAGLACRDLSYDVSWEAVNMGVLRCRNVLNRRTDIFDAVEGLDLSKILCDVRRKNACELLLERRSIRHIAVRLPKPFGPDNLYMSARLLPGNVAAGTFSAIAPGLDETIHGQAALLSSVSEARNREEGYRQEAELMLRGLRLLLGETTSREKLEALAGLMVGAIKGAAGQVLRIGRDGELRTLDGRPVPVADGQSWTDIWRSQTDLVSVHGDASPCIGRLRALVGAGQDDVALILLPTASGNIALVCGAGVKKTFSAEDVGIASRFALILQQALLLKTEQDKLVQSAKLSILGQMSASLAHELRQPLNTISMAAQNLEMIAGRGAVPPEQLAQKLTRILGQVDRASAIMDRMRGFSRNSCEQLSVTDLVPLAHGVRVLTEHVLIPAGIQLNVDMSGTLCAPCDPLRIEQVLVNLVRNAADALNGIGCRAKTPNGVITIAGRQTDNGVVLRIEDNGPGFPPDFIDKPIEAFFTTKETGAGTGLGLSISNTIAREHGGSLQLGNRAGGAFVELHLPGGAL